MKHIAAKVLTSQGLPVGYVETLPEAVLAQLVKCADAKGQVGPDARRRVADIMRAHYESQKAVVDPPDELIDEPTELEE